MGVTYQFILHRGLCYSANILKIPCHGRKLVNWRIDFLLFVSELSHSFLNQCSKDSLYSDMAVASLGMFLYHKPIKI